MSAVSGQCLCGAVRFSADNVDPEYWACQCSTCIRWSAGPFMTVACSGVSFDGEENIVVYDSSAWADRGFCRQCGTVLYYRMKGHDGYKINIGVFDDSSSFKMVGEIFVEDKPAGYDFAGDHPRLTGAEAIKKFSLTGI